MTCLARFCYRRRRLVLLLWIAGAAAVIFAGFGFGAPADNDFSGGDSDSGQAAQLLKDHFPRLGDTITLAIHADGGITDPGTKARVEPLLATLSHGPHVAEVTSPY